jgi:hypothetical protein
MGMRNWLSAWRWLECRRKSKKEEEAYETAWRKAMRNGGV